MAKKKQSFVSEDESYEWVEHSGREWIFFGSKFHYWRLTGKQHGSIRAELGNLEYERVKKQQIQNPYHIATVETYGKEEKQIRPGWKFYWFKDKFYLVDYAFPEEHVKNLIEQFHIDAKETKEKKTLDSKAAVQSEIDRVSRGRDQR